MNARELFRKRTAVLLLLACTSPALATDCYWTGGGGADQSWSNVANWMGNVAPTSTDRVYIGSSSLSPASVVITQPGAICQLPFLGYGGPYAGTLTIQAGGQLSSTAAANLGQDAGSTGAATVSGSGATWTDSGSLFVGRFGNATLDIEAGGQVSNTSATLGVNAGSTGTVTVNGAGSKWTNSLDLFVGFLGSGMLTVANGGLVATGTLYASLNDLHGNGTITAKGVVLDTDVIFDAAHGVSQTFAFGSGGTLKLVLDPTANLGAGSRTTGTLRITGGVSVSSAYGYLGYLPGSTGTATVSGAGSKWTNSGLVYVGRSGSGALNILGGGQVIGASNGFIGYFGTGTATVSGAGSKWTNGGELDVGNQNAGGTGTLTLADGGKVTAQQLYVGTSSSAIRLQVSGNDSIVAGGVNNYGKINFYTGPSLTAGTYHPISGATIWYTSTSASYNAIGGTWDNVAHTLAVPVVTERTAGDVQTTSSGQRLRFTDNASGKQLGASFGTITPGTTFSASLMAQSELDQLTATPGFAGSVLWAWDFNTNITGEVLLSGSVGPVAQTFQVWQFQSGTWATYTPSLQSYTADGMLSFTADHFSGYAVTAVPEPATLVLLAASSLFLLVRRTMRRALAV